MKLPALILFTIFLTQVLPAQNATPMQAWIYPYEVHLATLPDSTVLAYVDEGEGPLTLLFVHGLGSNLKAWSRNLDSLKVHYRCIALDLPGYGKSSTGNYPYDMQFFAHIVRQFIEHLSLEHIVLVGHSMGGQIALHLALEHAEMLRSLVLVAPAGFETFTAQEADWLEQVYTSAVVKATPEDQIIRNFELNFHQMPEDARFMIEDRLYMRQHSEYDAYCDMIPRCMTGMLRQPVFDRLPEIALPTLILFGKNDLLIPNTYLHPSLDTEQVAQSGQEGLSNSILLLFDQAGHFVQWEQSSGVNEAILRFLKEK